MSTTSPTPEPSRTRVAAVTGVTITAVVFIVVLLWSKWVPYTGQALRAAGNGTWSGSNVLGVGDVRPGDPPSWQAATSFLVAYGQAVWKALVAALLISAALQSLIPPGWMVRLLNRRGRIASAVAGGLGSTPSMMCTCCTAPVVVSLRRSGVSSAAAIAYWLGNPLLNPAVLVFLLLVAPWEWTATRLVVGLVVVVGGAALVARLTEGRHAPPGVAAQARGETADPDWLRRAPARFGRSLARLALVIVPEYLIIVLLVGAFRGWLFPLDAASGSGLLIVVLAAVVGTAVVIPTAGEIPILQGLAIAGVAAGPVGALLVTLPVVSLPGIVMVGRALGWRATAATGALAVAGGLLGAGLLMVL
ncbi:permease [Pseudonocardia sp. KRD291]|uniref:permease n=1 Tax=Pseudonocardia sp. KRD291 TaxID=2792007 RepID=UPI001C4A6F6B|nr:permease [Pseudonocardia sp. KRD291]MBW0102186.1 permease [Pseudonocardia sp. KRD291]